ncbi:MAG: hypothetical protein ACYC01_09835 [Lutibacter sp.]
MNSGTLIVGAIILVACILPFVLMIRSRKKKEKQLLLSLMAIANNHNCKITRHELFEEFGIGLDEKANKLFFFRKISENEIAKHINLADVKSCKVNKTSHSIGNSGENYNTIDRLELQFSFFDKKNQDEFLVFYNVDENTQLSGEIFTIENWDKIVNNRLKLQQKK